MRHAVLAAFVIAAVALIGQGCSDSDADPLTQSTLWLLEITTAQSTDGSPVVHDVGFRVRRDTGSGPSTPENGTVIRVLTSRGEFEDGTRDRCFLTGDGSILVTVRVPDTPDIVHCHDWQTGLVPVYLRNSIRPSTVFTIGRTG